jgi:hypothetical protein
MTRAAREVGVLALASFVILIAGCNTGAFDYQPIGPTEGVGPMAGSYGDPVLDRQLKGCNVAALARVGDFETGFLAPRCGRGVVCHANPLYPPDLKSPAAYRRLLDANVAYAQTMCDKSKDKYIDRAGADASFLVAKARDKPPKCPSGTSGGLPMPFDGLNPASPDEVACMISYINAVIEK